MLSRSALYSLLQNQAVIVIIIVISNNVHVTILENIDEKLPQLEGPENVRILVNG